MWEVRQGARAWAMWGEGSSAGSQGTLAHLWDQCQDLACPEVWLGGRGREGVSWPQKAA